MKTIKTRLVAIFTLVILIITGILGMFTISTVSRTLINNAHEVIYAAPVF